MAALFCIRVVVCESGERLPLLIELSTGLPLFDPTVFTLSQVRARNRSSASAEQTLRAVRLFVAFCLSRGIDLDERFRQGRILELGEVDALLDLCRRPLASIDESVVCAQRASGKSSQRPSFGRILLKPKSQVAQVSAQFAAARARYISRYIDWLANRCLLGWSGATATRAALISARDALRRSFSYRMPAEKFSGGRRERLALSRSEQDVLWRIVDPDSPENPWGGSHARKRNDLAIRWLMGLGLRRGELLGIKISDLDFQANQVFIARRADDPNDPRVSQPNAKTRDRILPMSTDLVARTRDYIIQQRRKFPAARKHEFLFVSNGGRPLTLRGLNKVFEVLSDRLPGIVKVHPHLLRHTANHNFSEIADGLKMTPELEKKTRSQLMGWSEASNSAEIYTRREVRRKAREASLQLQASMNKPTNENDE